MEKEIEILKEHYGNHSSVAKALGITPRYYRVLRNGVLKPGNSLRKLIREMVRIINIKAA